MRPFFALIVLLIAARAPALDLPASVTLADSAGPGHCEASWYVNLNELNFFRAFSPCEAGLAVFDPGTYLDAQGRQYTELFAFMTRNIKDSTVLHLAWLQPVKSVLIRVCTGCNDAFTVPDRVDVSADGLGWERLTCVQTNSSRAAQGEPASVLFDPDADAQHLFGIAECTWTLPAPAHSMYIRGVESDTSDGTSIASVEGVADTDADGVADRSDNCKMVANPAQTDTDDDGIGNLCDADLDNNCTVNFLDLGEMKSVFFSADPDADLDGNGAVDFADLGLLKQDFFRDLLADNPSGRPNICAGN